MFDGKILAAVFVTLAAVAVGMNGGSLDANGFDAVNTWDFPEIGDFNPNSVGAFSMFLETPDPETRVKGNLKIDQSEKQSFRLKAESVYIETLTELEVDNREMKSDGGITLNDFDGDIKLDDGLKIEGSSRGFTSSGVNVSGEIDLDEDVERGTVRAEGVKKSPLNVKGITGNISSNTTSATLDSETDLSINSFSGNFTYTANGTFVFSGKVARLDAGSVSFGN